MATKLTTKQQRFVDAYDGNATRAALAAGYSAKTAAFIGAENLKKPKIAAAIKTRQEKKSRPLIASREDRQEFWTQVMMGRDVDPATGEPPRMADRLRAAELLAKSEGDFLDRVDHTSSDGSMTPKPLLDVSKLSQAARKEILDAAGQADA